VTPELQRGSVVWVDLNPTRGREQAGTRPAVVIATDDYLHAVPDLAIVLPVTTRDRGWPHHVPVTGPGVRLRSRSFAMTEQPRTIARSRISRIAGVAGNDCMVQIDRWLRDFTGL
jgi:Growth inhibitor